MIHFDLPELRAKLEELHKKMEAPDFWNDVEAANKVTREIKPVEAKVKHFDRLSQQSDDIDSFVHSVSIYYMFSIDKQIWLTL